MAAHCSYPNSFFIFFKVSSEELLQAREVFGERKPPGCVLQRGGGWRFERRVATDEPKFDCLEQMTGEDAGRAILSTTKREGD